MIEHIETYENASKYLWDKTKTIPHGYADRGTGLETVRARKDSVERFLITNRKVIIDYYSYQDKENTE